jgi:hypothetical protein
MNNDNLILNNLSFSIEELDINIDSIKDFMHTADFGKLPAIEQGFYMMQLSDMQKLKDTLDRRFEHYKEKIRPRIPLEPKEAVKALAEGLRIYKRVWHSSSASRNNQYIELDDQGYIIDENNKLYQLTDFNGFFLYTE